jgi:hypothetical protein
MKPASLRSTRKAPLVTKRAPAFSLVEAILSASLFGLFVTACVGAYLYGLESTRMSGSRMRAVLLADEGIEAVRNIHDAGFANIPDGTYGLGTSGNQWALSGTQDTTNGFTRQIIIATVDAVRKRVTSRITWQQNIQRAGVIALGTQLTHWFAAAVGDWTLPRFIASASVSGSQDAVRIAVQYPYAYLIRSGGSPNLAVFNITNPQSPVVAGSMTLPGAPTGIAVSGAVAYVSNQHNAQELQVVNVTNPASLSVMGTYDAPGTANANAIAIQGNAAYLVRDSSTQNEIVALSVASPATPTLLGSLNLNATARDIAIQGTAAYIASDHPTQSLQIIDIHNPTAPYLVGAAPVNPGVTANGIAVASTTVAIAQGDTLFTLNVSVSSSPLLLGNVNAGALVKDVTIGPNDAYAFIGTASSTAEFQVIRIPLSLAPTRVGALDLPGTDSLNGVTYDAGTDRTYGASSNNGAEFQVIGPQ